MKINTLHISQFEDIFINGKSFDSDRVSFIKNLETCDLLAVPGSGKTTALMAKLYALSKHLPFQNGCGILVLSHTNAAVAEIENKLKPHCPTLFSYPNFIGTIQSFVNKFLANQGNLIKNGNYLCKVDDEISNRRIFNSLVAKKGKLYWFLVQQIKSKHSQLTEKYITKHDSNINFKEFITKLKQQKILNKKGHLDFDYGKVIKSQLTEKEKTIIFKFNSYINSKSTNKEHIIDKISSFKIDYIKNNFTTSTTPLSFGSQSGGEFLELLSNNLENGYSRYKDCYSLASWFVSNYPTIKQQLQERFKYVFIDEMQDLENYQIELIDTIFLKGEGITVLQRIGDVNQSIYSSGKSKAECDWKTRNEIYLTGSNRLTKTNAQIVNCFTLDSKNGKFIVEGNNQLIGGDIPPHLIVFSTETKDRIKIEFQNLIYKYKLTDKKEASNGFKIIGWVGERQDEGDGKLSLYTLFGFSKEKKSTKDDFDSLSKHIQLFNKDKKTLEAVRKSILNAIITILRLEGKKITKTVQSKKIEQFFTENDLIQFIKGYNNDGEFLKTYEDFKHKLFNWCFNLVTSESYSVTFLEIVYFIKKELKLWFDLSLNEDTMEFIGEVFKSINPSQGIDLEKIKVLSNLNIEIGTIHSVKGQTHCATMYVETAYKTPTYETQKLKEESITNTIKKKDLKTNPLFKQFHSCEGAFAKEALKMMYVGFSRPTHLLCFATLLENVRDDIGKFKDTGWTIINLSNENL